MMCCENNTRYNHVLEAVVSYTEELAYKQAKEADKLLARGLYLGTSLFKYCDDTLRVAVTFPAFKILK